MPSTHLSLLCSSSATTFKVRTLLFLVLLLFVTSFAPPPSTYSTKNEHFSSCRFGNRSNIAECLPFVTLTTSCNCKTDLLVLLSPEKRFEVDAPWPPFLSASSPCFFVVFFFFVFSHSMALPSSENLNSAPCGFPRLPYFTKKPPLTQNVIASILFSSSTTSLPWFVVAVFVFLVMAAVSFHAAVVNDGDGDGGGGGGCIARFDRKRFIIAQSLFLFTTTFLTLSRKDRHRKKAERKKERKKEKKRKRAPTGEPPSFFFFFFFARRLLKVVVVV